MGDLVHEFGVFAGEATFPHLYPAFYSFPGGARPFSSRWRLSFTSSSAPRFRMRLRRGCSSRRSTRTACRSSTRHRGGFASSCAGSSRGRPAFTARRPISTRPPACIAATPPASFRFASARPCASPEDAFFPDAARDPVRVEALEQQLRRAASRPEQVSEAGERDGTFPLALLDRNAPGLGVRGRPDGEPGAEPDKSPFALQVASELCVLDLHGNKPGAVQLQLDLVG